MDRRYFVQTVVKSSGDRMRPQSGTSPMRKTPVLVSPGHTECAGVVVADVRVAAVSLDAVSPESAHAVAATAAALRTVSRANRVERGIAFFSAVE